MQGLQLSRDENLKYQTKCPAEVLTGGQRRGSSHRAEEGHSREHSAHRHKPSHKNHYSNSTIHVITVCRAGGQALYTLTHLSHKPIRSLLMLFSKVGTVTKQFPPNHIVYRWC